MLISSVSDFRAAVRNGAYAWVGGHPLYFVRSDGAALSFAAVKAERRNILYSIAHHLFDSWRIVGMDINWDDANLYCEHTGKRIESAYAEEEQAA